MELRFSTDLPPGAHIVGDGPRSGGINKKDVEVDLRANPGQWALVYENTVHRTALDWRKRPGFEAATEALPNQTGMNPGNKKYKVWVRYVGVGGLADEPQSSITQTGIPVESAEAEPVPSNPVAPPAAPSAPAPLNPGAVSAPPRTAFQQAFAQGETSNPEIAD